MNTDNKIAAQFFLKKGLSVMPVHKTKNPALSEWSYLRDELLENVDLHPKTKEPLEWNGIGMLTGRANNNCECIDVDTKYDLTGTLWDRLKTNLDDAIPGIMSKVVIAKTISGGYHLVYTCDKIEGNLKLASREPTSAEIAVKDNGPKTVIETRGEGGYICVAPTAGYELLQGKYSNLPHITIAERDTIVAVCCSFTEIQPEEKLNYNKKENKEEDPYSPFVAYNAKGSFKELIEKHGWKFVYSSSERDYYLRPGGTSKTSGNWHKELNRFYNWSSGANIPVGSLDLSELYARLECNGDKKMAYKQLIADGYGSFPPKPVVNEWWYYGKMGVGLEPKLYVEFLTSNGFFKYYKDGVDKPTFVHVVNNIVSVVSPEKIKDFVFEWLRKGKHDDVEEFCIAKTTMFKEDWLTALHNIELETLRGDANKDYICYRNGVVVVSKNKIQVLGYSEFNTYIWQNHIIQRDFVFHDNFTNHYQQFIDNVSIGEIEPLESAIGYLIATHKDKSNNKAIILNDAEISDDPNGGSGKGLVMQGISNLRRTVIIDGKNWSDTSAFPYQAVDEDTQILFFDDVKRHFNFENKFSIVTEGITVEKKNKQSFFIPVEKSPKLAISTNYVVQGSGNSHDRRKLEFELAKIYGKDRTPQADFGCQLFDDWTEIQWQKFDNYMAYCLQQYIKNGVVAQKGTNIKIKRLINETSNEFYEWAITYFVDFSARYFNAESKSAFFKEYPQFDSKFKGEELVSSMRWSKWIKSYATFLEASQTTGNVGGKGRWITFTGGRHTTLISSVSKLGSSVSTVSESTKNGSFDDTDDAENIELPF